MAERGPLPQAFIDSADGDLADAEDMAKVMAASADLITVMSAYVLADKPEDEALTYRYVTDMIDRTAKTPEKAAEIITALLSLIVSIRMGGDTLTWFEKAGISIPPMIDAETGKHA